MTAKVTEGLGNTTDPLNLESSEEEETPGDGDHDEDVEKDVSTYVIQNNPVEVKRKNKIICITAYIILILWMTLYISLLVGINAHYKEITHHSYYADSIIAICAIFGSDILACIVGMWTCLTKTGPKPMIFACVWLLLTSLVNLCVTVSLVLEGKSAKEARELDCIFPDAEGCKAYFIVKVVLWCSLCSLIFKFIVITLCRFNYPQVFNWMVGKHVYVDETLVDEVDPVHLNVGGGMFDTCDIARLSARGSVGGKVRKLQDQRTIVVTQKSDLNVAGEIGTGTTTATAAAGNEAPLNRPFRRPTLVSVTSNTSDMMLKLKQASGQIL